MTRGPLIYCFEGVDNQIDLNKLKLNEEEPLREFYTKDSFYRGLPVIKALAKSTQEAELYGDKLDYESEQEITGIPYFLWGNRGVNQMRIWLIT